MFSLCGKTANRRVSADDRSDRLGTAIAIFDERYDGSPDSRTLYVRVATLKLILHLTTGLAMLMSYYFGQCVLNALEFVYNLG